MHTQIQKYLAILILTLAQLPCLVHAGERREGSARHYSCSKALTTASAFSTSPQGSATSRSTPFYVAAQGQQISFRRKPAGTWIAQIVDGWQRVQELPVVGTFNQDLDEAIAALADKAPRQHCSGIHVIDKDASTGNTGIVYVGALGVRGGITPNARLLGGTREQSAARPTETRASTSYSASTPTSSEHNTTTHRTQERSTSSDWRSRNRSFSSSSHRDTHRSSSPRRYSRAMQSTSGATSRNVSTSVSTAPAHASSASNESWLGSWWNFFTGGASSSSTPPNKDVATTDVDSQQEKAQSASTTNAVETSEADRKMPSLPPVTHIKTPEAGKEAVAAYVKRWHLETPAGREALKAQGQELLKSVEALKVTHKNAYRSEVEAFVTEDIDPTAWNMVLERQRDTKAQTDTLRTLRGQLVDVLQPTKEVLEEAGMQATCNVANEVTYYSSDEDEQPLSTKEAQRRREIGKKIVKEVISWTVAPEARAAKALGKTVGLAKKVQKGAKATKGVKGGQKAAGQVGKASRSVVQRGEVPPGNLNKLRNNQGWRDSKGNVWKKDMKHKDHWDVIDPKTGRKLKEVDFEGKQIWPQGPKNKNKR